MAAFARFEPGITLSVEDSAPDCVDLIEIDRRLADHDVFDHLVVARALRLLLGFCDLAVFLGLLSLPLQYGWTGFWQMNLLNS